MTRWLACPADYHAVWQSMQAFTAARDADTPDEIWLCEHAPVYTLGQAGRPAHVHASGDIPIVHSDRGGQVTYHGPGQVVAYVLVDLRRLGVFVKDYVSRIETAVIQTLDEYGVADACRRPGAPGVYVVEADGDYAKIAALGVKIKNGRAYHGVALNVDMDLSPFSGIDPCGYAGLRTTDMARQGGRKLGLRAVGDSLAEHLTDVLR